MRQRIVEAILKTKVGRMIADRQLDSLSRLYVGKSRQELRQQYIESRLKVMVPLLVVVLLVYAGVYIGSGPATQILQDALLQREDPGGNTRTVALQVEVEGIEKQVQLKVSARELNREQLEAEFVKGEKYLSEHYLGKNRSAEQVSKPLCLMTELPNSPLAVEWRLDGQGLVQEDGSLQCSDIEEPTSVEITACLSYQEEEYLIPFQMTILPQNRSNEELFWLHWNEAVDRALETTSTEQTVKLPETVDGKAVQYYTTQESQAGWIAFAGILLLGLMPLVMNQRIKQQMVLREKQLQRDYPDMIEQFVLLVGAGLPIKGAWTRMAGRYLQTQENKGADKKTIAANKKYLYEEMCVTMREMESGMCEQKAYELFGKRVGMLCYMKFSSLLVQNLKKGSEDLLRLLEQEATESFRMRKEYAMKCGEEASTRLLFPMMLMLLVVFAIILYAAFQSM
ncbi:MAG: hypothetical protein MR316_08375 [Lachnospiraceae bacterium]|nr:hypothetical protein [Lachnospiraceae bacterium]